MQSVSRTQLGPNNQKKKFALFRGGEAALSILVPIPQDDLASAEMAYFLSLPFHIAVSRFVSDSWIYCYILSEKFSTEQSKVKTHSYLNI